MDERWSRHQLNPVTAAPPQMEMGVQHYHDNYIKLVKDILSQNLYFIVYFPTLHDNERGMGVKRSHKIVMRQL